MSAIIFSLLGLAGLAFILDSDDDDGAETPEEEVVELTGDTVTATQGDDVITGDIIAELEGYDDIYCIAELNLLGGDDSVGEDVFGNGCNVTVNAGDGDDTVEFDGYTYVNGGDGDDFISGYMGDINGDAGNDTIVADIGFGLPDSGPSMSGGAGDDVLHVQHTLGTDNTYDNVVAQMTGGDGNDEFIVELFDGVEPSINASGILETLSVDRVQVEGAMTESGVWAV